MQLTLLLPGLHAVSKSRTFARWLDRGDRLDEAKPGRSQVLRTCFDFPGTAFPIAALTRTLDCSDAAVGQWLRADPAYVMADAVTLRLIASGDMGLTDDESAQLASALQPMFGDAGFPLEATRPDRWYLRCPRESRLPTFAGPEDALGDDLARHLPDGENARRWRGLLNEAQMMLHQHPVNAQRARRGMPPVNSLWLWGAGALPDWVRCGASRICSDDDVVTALARQAKAASIVPVPSNFSALAAGAASASILLDLADRRDLAELDSRWFGPIDAALKARRLTSLTLLGARGERWVTKPSHRWRFWRRTSLSG